MLLSIAVVLVSGYAVGKIVDKLGFPSLLGMLLVGVLLGPYVLNELHPDLLMISQDLRSFALIVILLRAGLGIRKEQLQKVGITALKLSSLPCLLEGLIITGLAYMLLGFSLAEAGMLGFIIAAVSPAVVVPSMLELKAKGYGKKNEIPTLILAGSSIDDVFAITLFTFFLGLGTGEGGQSIAGMLAHIPFSILAGILGGVLCAFALSRLFKRFFSQKRSILPFFFSLLLAVLYYEVGEALDIASLLGVMSIGFILVEIIPKIADGISRQLSIVWFFAQILLFALIGAEVNIQVAWQAGGLGLLIIACGLIARSLGVWLATLGTELNTKERIFCMIAYTPKATVQAAIGAIPLTLGVADGQLILAIAVLSIIVTAPLGALAISASAPKLLDEEPMIAVTE